MTVYVGVSNGIAELLIDILIYLASPDDLFGYRDSIGFLSGLNEAQTRLRRLAI